MTAWVTASQVREVAQVSTADYSDSDLNDFIALAQKEVNSKIISRKVREPVSYLDSYRSNYINGTNTTFFVQNWKGNWFGDLNYDNTIDTSDITVVQYDPNTLLETTLSISSISVSACSFTLSSAPANGVQLYVTYAYTPIDPVTPDPFLALVTKYLAGSYIFIGNDGFDIRFGNVEIKPGKSGGKGFQLYNQYLELLRQLNVNATGGSSYTDMATKI